jgi:aminoglycoside phosphotransferase (APT) family kinase protein
MRFDARARDWLTRVLGPGHRVVDARRARGGVASVVHRVRVVDARDHGSTYMLRRVPFRDDVPNHDPAAEVLNESYALRRVGGGPIPELVAVDPSGDECGVAALASTWLPGRPELAPTDPGPWVRELAAAVGAVPATAGPGLAFADFEPWFDPDGGAPAWSRVPAAWEQVRTRLDIGLPPSGEPRFVHRDFHPGNVLLHRGRFSGIVDWTQASVGPPEVDVSRTRVEIAMLTDGSVADAFLQQTGCAPTYDPLWDALVACELGPWSHEMLVFNDLGARLTLNGVRATLDAFVEAAARRL